MLDCTMKWTPETGGHGGDASPGQGTAHAARAQNAVFSLPKGVVCPGTPAESF